jgi:hypothetical protein
MDTVIITGSHIKRIRYGDDKVLRVEFEHDVYNYTGVSQEDYDALVAAHSTGGYLHSHIIPRYGKGDRVESRVQSGRKVGYLNERHQTTSENRIDGATAVEGHCPASGCATPAQGFIPPDGDNIYKAAIEMIKGEFNLKADDDEGAALKMVKRNGGYIETCHVCGTTYFVKAAKAKLKPKSEPEQE